VDTAVAIGTWTANVLAAPCRIRVGTVSGRLSGNFTSGPFLANCDISKHGTRPGVRSAQRETPCAAQAQGGRNSRRRGGLGVRLLLSSYDRYLTHLHACRKPFEFRLRNFDPETRTLRKHDPSKDEADTVEKQVEGLAERIVQEDEEKRAQELVSSTSFLCHNPRHPCWANAYRTC
jgi:hypothetical protein